MNFYCMNGWRFARHQWRDFWRIRGSRYMDGYKLEIFGFVVFVFPR